MDYLMDITLIGSILCLIAIEYVVYRIKESERIKARIQEVRRYSPVLESAGKK